LMTQSKGITLPNSPLLTFYNEISEELIEQNEGSFLASHNPSLDPPLPIFSNEAPDNK
ncbi:8801_t:CDS:2, partial [Racocetra persica]